MNGKYTARLGPEVARAVATFCTGYAGGVLVVRPLLHKIFPSP